MTKRKWLLKALRLILIFAVLLFLGYKQGQFFGYSFGPTDKQSVSGIPAATLTEIQEWFPNAYSFSESDIGILNVYDRSSQRVGYILSSKPYSDSIIGYAGSVHFIMGVTTDHILKGIKLTEHNESPGYISFIDNEGFFKKFQDKSIKHIVSTPIDAVSGATLTCDAITEAAKKRLAKHLDIVFEQQAKGAKKKTGNILTLVVVVFALLSFFFRYFRRYRLVLLILSIAILGFYQGTFISMFLLQGWTYAGVPFVNQWLLSAVVVISIILPLILNKSFYCNYLCPYGAAQELVGKINKKRKNVPFRHTPFMKYLRESIFILLIISVISGLNIDLTNVEPFTAFVFKSASYIAIVLALVFLMLSVFFNKPWCYYFCPTGQLLAFFRVSKKR